ncbi:Gfo/Idh/MocA family protein, partial [Bacteroidota bacterium]
RHFVKKAASAGLVAGAVPFIIDGKPRTDRVTLEPLEILEKKKYAANDKLRLGVIGTGIISHFNIDVALQTGGVELAACCDLYDGRLTRAKEMYGNHIITTRDYREILNRDDIDLVLIATPDHWHDIITIDAMKAGKAVYCEKPMVQTLKEGHNVIAAEKKYKAKFQVGSQGVSSILFKKAQDLYRAGEIGDLILVEAAYDRHSTLGAWQYSIPPDASPENIDFDTFLGDTAKVPFDLIRFFRWRNYQAYGTGIAGDLFVHLFSWLHFTISSNGPNRVFGSGGTRYWKDGRDVPDILTCVVDYPQTTSHAAFNMQIRVNFTAGGGGEASLKLVGTEGTLKFADNMLTLSRTPFPNKPEYGGYDSLFTFPEAVQKEFVKQYEAKYYDVQPMIQPVATQEFKPPEGYDERKDHWANLVAAVKNNKPIVEDATYGLRAAGPSLAANDSYFNNRIVKWDPDKMNIIK